MQLSNQPAEALAKQLVDSSDGAFEIVGYASGGKDPRCRALSKPMLIVVCRHGSDGRCYQTRTTGV